MNKKLLISLGAVGCALAICMVAGCMTQNPETTLQPSGEEIATTTVVSTEDDSTGPVLTETTEAVQDQATDPTQTMQTGSEQETSAAETTVPETTVPETTAAATEGAALSDWDRYNNMSAAEQKAFYESFANPQDYFDWINAAKEAHEKNSNDIVIGEGGTIDWSDIIGGNNP